jgi:hypothetical protein
LTPLHWLAQRNAADAVLQPLAAACILAGADLEAREQLYGAQRFCACAATPAASSRLRCC